ncbi:hypothetical protein C8R46DRAFT_901977 [Mycena filopes]|nr:hypothetical protein C8R46DRAFT_901977 [Mycena filopes]
MRYACCTDDDVKFLRSRVAGRRPTDPHLDTAEFRDVSIITALNIHKDTINNYGAERFAADTGQELVEFYSVDRLSPRAVDRTKWKQCEQAFFKTLGPRLQDQIWRASPSLTSDFIPGCLKLCLGMPVMLRSNEATELCVTKGQEGIVVGWEALNGPGDHLVLDTLFVELVNPPRDIQIPGLELNVVPIPRSSVHQTCLLRDDTLLSIMREQVFVLLNFAMTDYGSQGKSRKKNVVHLNNCKDHRAYYVALSRGTHAATTVILQGFDASKIQTKMSGHLRQEFRELEILDKITKLWYLGKLPSTVRGIYRGQLIRAFKLAMGSITDDPDLHPAIKTNELDRQRDDETTERAYPSWNTNRPDQAHTDNAQSPRKRKAPKQSGSQPKRRKRSDEPAVEKGPAAEASAPVVHSVTTRQTGTPTNDAAPAPPIGLIWDRVNYSCGYDSVLTALGYIWSEDPAAWNDKFTRLSPMLGIWANTLTDCHRNRWNIEHARDVLRYNLNFTKPDNFPYGPRNLRLDDLFAGITNSRPYGYGTSWCSSCGYISPGHTETFGQLLYANFRRDLLEKHPVGVKLSDWFRWHFDRNDRATCPSCTARGVRTKQRITTRIQEVPNLMIVSVNHRTVAFDPWLVFEANNVPVLLRLRCLVYHNGNVQHFTSRIITKDGFVWYHDGMTTARNCIPEGPYAGMSAQNVQHRGHETLCAAIYST